MWYIGWCSIVLSCDQDTLKSCMNNTEGGLQGASNTISFVWGRQVGASSRDQAGRLELHSIHRPVENTEAFWQCRHWVHGEYRSKVDSAICGGGIFAMFVSSEQVEYPLSAWDQKYFTLVTFFSDSFQRICLIYT